jgi:hypothetical protein
MMGDVPPLRGFLNQRRLQMDKKILGILPKTTANVLLCGMIAAFVLAWIWSIIMAQSFSQKHAWVTIVELLLYAVLVGAAVGMFAGNVKKSTLWIAAGLTVVGVAIASGLVGAGMQMAGFDSAVLGTFMSGEAFSTTVGIGSVVLGIIAAASVALGTKAEV